jgi:MFS family permease
VGVHEHEDRGRLIAPEAIRPGILLAATLIGITGFSIFLPLYAPDVGVDDVGPLFLVYGVVVVLVRLLGAKLPDRLGPLRAGTIAIGATTVGLATLGVWQSTVGLVVATVIVAVGSSFLYPSMLLLVLRGVPEQKRGSVVGTFSAFFDFAGGASGIVLGALAAASSYAGAFLGAAVLAGVALVLLRSGFAQHETGDLPTVAEVGTASVEPTSLP